MANILSITSPYVVPTLIGAAGGYLFYRAVGCRTGMCPITRNPWLSILYGALIGASMGPL
jgi:hypothetical protein